MVNGLLRDLYMVFLCLQVYEVIFGYDLLFQPARVALVAISVVLVLAIPFRSFSASSSESLRRPQLTAPKAGPSSLPRIDKCSSVGKIRGFRYCRSEMQGWRPAMEDAACVDEFHDEDVPGLKEWAFFGVFDGHGGWRVSRRLANEVSSKFYDVCREKYSDSVGDESGREKGSKITPMEIKEALGLAFARMDYALRKTTTQQGEFDFVGSTGIVVLINQEYIVCANVGDSRAILCRDGAGVDLSEDHKPEAPDERKRIEKAGGTVAQIGPCYRVDGWGLNLSRAFGDFHYKARSDLEPWEQKVSAEPEIRIVKLEEPGKRDSFVVLGCDGVFELLRNQDVIEYVHERFEAFGDNMPDDRLQRVTESLLDQCVSPNLLVTQGKGGDNVSAILIKL